jgi:predicted RNase H-like HicB family nuclease
MSRLHESGARKIPVHITVDMALLDRIDAEAEQAGYSRSEFIRRMIESGMAVGAKRERTPRPRTEKVVVAGREFTYTVERDRHWWGAQVAELPGCWSQGRTLTELREMVADAIESVLIVRGEIPDNAAASPAV